MSVREPAADGNRMLRVKYVRCWRIVDDNRLSQIASDLRKVLHIKSKRHSGDKMRHRTNLHIISLVVVATITE